MSLILTGVIDGPLSGGLPKAIELFVTADIADLSQYGIGFANNGGGTDGQEFTFPAVAASAGDFIYVASEATGFQNYLGFAPDHTSGFASINGDDAIEVFQSGAVIDRYGDPAVDGTGTVWEHLDGWASRKPGTSANPVFDPGDWIFSGPNALDGETSNATAGSMFPIGAYDMSEPPAPSIVINEIDADQTSTDSAEFIELYDGGAGNTSLDGLSLVLFNGNGDAEYDTISLSGFSTDADGFFVVGSANVPNVDLIEFTTNGLQNGADAVALYSGTPPSSPTTENLVDALVYGTNDPDDTGLLTALGLATQHNESENGSSTTDSLSRVPDGAAGFVAQAPTPGETNVLPEPPVTMVKIHEIQDTGGTPTQVGTDDRSLLEGSVVSIEAIVTADFQDGVLGSMGDLNGFYVQEEEIDYDMNALTSEGIFVFDGSSAAVDVAVGDLVQITGTVSEFFGETQLSASEITVVSSGNLLPDAVDVTFPVASAYLTDDGDYVANLEAYEGMRINIAQDMVLTEMFNLDRFGQYDVAAERLVQFTQNHAPDATGFDQHQQDQARSRITLDDGRTTQNPDPIRVIDGNDGFLGATDSFRMGDTIGNIEGVVTYAFDAFRIHAPTGDYSQENPRELAPEEVAGNFRVASLNVLNFFTTLDEDGNVTDTGLDPRGADNAAEYDRQLEKLVNAIVAMDVDVLGLVEVENDSDDAAMQAIVDAVNDRLGSTVYAVVPSGLVGGDAIKNGLIYKPGTTALNGDLAVLDEFNGIDFKDPLDAGRPLNRPAIAQTFEDLETGETITISVNHLKSKGSLSGLDVDEAQGDGQGNNNATRTAAAELLADWLDSDPTGQEAENVLILGDLNAYAREDPVTALTNAGFTDLAAEELGEEGYSFVFSGQTGTLDYALASEELTGKLAGITEWHINADEPDAVDYNLDFGRNPALFDGDSPHRNSDHDPVIVGFTFEKVFNEIVGTDKRDYLPGTEGCDRIEGLDGHDRIVALAGEDLILGGGGRDFVFGGDGNDTIEGGDDADRLFGEDGSDILIAGNGFGDRLFGGADRDIFRFSADVAEDGLRDAALIMDFDVTEDVIDLGGAVIDDVIVRGPSIILELAGGDDWIHIRRVTDFDEIDFVGDDLNFV